MANRIHSNYDEIAEAYDSKYVGPYWDLCDYVTLNRAMMTLPAEGHVLDAGAGTGRMALHLLDRGYELTLLDPSRAMLDVARKKIQSRFPNSDCRYIVGKIETMEFKDGSFGGVFSDGDPLSYCITTHTEAAREIVRVLKPGGTFYVSCDNRWDAALIMASAGRTNRAFEAAEKGVSTDPYGVPVHAFDSDELRELFLDAGAEDVVVTGKIHLTHHLRKEAFDKIAQDRATFKKWYELEAALAQKPSMAGQATHLTVTGRKP